MVESRRFDEVLRDARRCCGLSQSRAAALVGVSLSAYKRWESARVIPSASKRALAISALRGEHRIVDWRSMRFAGLALRVARLEAGCSQRQAANRIAVSLATYNRLERGAIGCGADLVELEMKAFENDSVGRHPLAAQCLAIARRLERRELDQIASARTQALAHFVEIGDPAAAARGLVRFEGETSIPRLTSVLKVFRNSYGPFEPTVARSRAEWLDA